MSASAVMMYVPPSGFTITLTSGTTVAAAGITTIGNCRTTTSTPNSIGASIRNAFFGCGGTDPAGATDTQTRGRAPTDTCTAGLAATDTGTTGRGATETSISPAAQSTSE
ncbi:hypothetical protein ACFULT_26240 [Rhodococcus sp. NPDC057297]|uniref:hypothetical protein n=1 Tax=Rhodococcus sp. NPDC057297 TaxID=3346090 RepID=UPI00363DF36E